MEEGQIWIKKSTTSTFESTHLRTHSDIVTGPSGRAGEYSWIETLDQVRVAPLVDGHVVLVEQTHYLIGRSFQLPGGSVDAGETDSAAAARELKQETGLHGGVWLKRGFIHPMPSLSPARVHLWVTHEPIAGAQDLESNEADLQVHHVQPEVAVEMAFGGQLTCAASTALILALFGSQDGRS